MRGSDILEHFERVRRAWVCTAALTIHFPHGKLDVEPGASIDRDTWVGRQLDQISALGG